MLAGLVSSEASFLVLQMTLKEKQYNLFCLNLFKLFNFIYLFFIIFNYIWCSFKTWDWCISPTYIDDFTKLTIEKMILILLIVMDSKKHTLLRSKTFFPWWVCPHCWFDKFSLSLSVILLKFISSKIQFACLCIKIRGTWLELEIIILSETGQTDKGSYFEEKEQSSRIKIIWSWILIPSVY